jgi:hypothetical protein
MHKKLYLDLGYTSILIYATEAREFRQTKAYYYISMSRSLEVLPEIRKAIAKGEIEWTKVKEVTRVATPKTEV